MADLKTTYVDDILNTSKNTKRKYNMIANSDGTVSFEDVTDYSQEGDSFGAADVNAITAAINQLNSDLSAGKLLTQFYMTVGTGCPTDCNDLKVGSIAYAYGATANSPGTTAGWIIFTFGASENYKVQLAILTTSGEIKTRGLSDSGGWTAWV